MKTYSTCDIRFFGNNGSEWCSWEDVSDIEKENANLRAEVERLRGELERVNQSRKEALKTASENRRLRKRNKELREDNVSYEKRTNRQSSIHRKDSRYMSKLIREIRKSSVRIYEEEHKMKLYYNNTDWVVANTKEEAGETVKRIMGEDYLDHDEAKTFEVIPNFLEVTLGITDDPGGPTETKTAGEWAKAHTEPDIIASKYI